MRIFLKGCLFESMKKFKYFFIFTLFLPFLVPSSWAQMDKWPWTFEDGNFQITNNSGDNFSPAIASACQNDSCLYLVVWSRKTSSGFDIFGARISRDGKVFPEDMDGFPICTAPNDQMYPAVGSDGENFLVVWQDMRSGRRWEIYGARVTTGGQVLDRNQDQDCFKIAIGKLTYDQVSPALAFDGENYLVVWQGKRSPKLWNLYYTMVSKDGKILFETPIPLALYSKNQVSPSVTFNGENYFIVWQDFRSGKFWDIYGARVAPSGLILDEDKQGIPISPTFPNDHNNTSTWDKWRPVLSWDGNFFLVIWMASRERNKWYLEGKRVDSNGVPADLIDVQIQKDTTNKTFPAIVWDGDQYVLVWEEEPEGVSKVYGVSILSQYIPFTMSEAVPISSPDAKDPSYLGISAIGDEVLIVWQGKDDAGYWHIFGQRLKKVQKILPVGPV